MAGLRNTGNSTPNPDAVEEVPRTDDSYNAEYGRFAAGIITGDESGTNQFTGRRLNFGATTH